MARLARVGVMSFAYNIYGSGPLSIQASTPYSTPRRLPPGRSLLRGGMSWFSGKMQVRVCSSSRDYSGKDAPCFPGAVSWLEGLRVLRVLKSPAKVPCLRRGYFCGYEKAKSGSFVGSFPGVFVKQVFVCAVFRRPRSLMPASPRASFTAPAVVRYLPIGDPVIRKSGFFPGASSYGPFIRNVSIVSPSSAAFSPSASGLPSRGSHVDA